MKKLLSLLLVAALALGLCTPVLAAGGPELKLIAPDNWELGIGDSRTLDYTFSSDVTNRMLIWESDDEAVAAVDEWGRVTGVSAGEATITATQINGAGLTDSLTVQVVAAPTGGVSQRRVVNYSGGALAEVKNLQKIVTRWSIAEANTEASGVPAEVITAIDAADKTGYHSAKSADGADWAIKTYGVLRVGGIAATSRDEEMRFMGDRYFYGVPTPRTANNGTTFVYDYNPIEVLAILSDGENGIWAITATGVTHIEMVEMSAAGKADKMSATTQEYVSRRGMVSEANLTGGKWVPRETDNDGLWTAMYGAGELMRYASLKKALAANPLNTELQRQTAEARKSAMLASEAVLLLANISMREGEVEAYVRYQREGFQQDGDSKFLSPNALLKDGDDSRLVPSVSPADDSLKLDVRSAAQNGGDLSKAFSAEWLKPFDGSAWADTSGSSEIFAKKTRSLGGFIARTYSLHGEPGGNGDSYSGEIYYDFAGYTESNKTAVGKSQSRGIINNENLKGVQVNAAGEIPSRLWDDLLGAGVDIQDIVYKGDTSCDEIIGHLFIYKLAYDILGAEDAELRDIIATTMDNFARHLSDNEYMLVDATGQPTTWGKLNREYFYSYRWGAPSSPLTSSVLLCAFKLAAYCTGYQKWADEYNFLLTNGTYLYGDVMNDHNARNAEFLNVFALGITGNNILTDALAVADSSGRTYSFLAKTFAQYSDEEMAMLAFYLLFQLEDDQNILKDYRSALDQWWNESMQYSENPLWYYIYQLAYPNAPKTDAYGNNLLETAAWSLSRHPIDTRKWNASNIARDDISNFDLEMLSKDFDTRGGLSYRIEGSTVDLSIAQSQGVLPFLLSVDLKYAVAAPDERAMHKYNGSSYILATDYNPNQMEGSTTYTLPYWMGVYHGMLELSAYDYVAPPVGPVTPTEPEKPKEPTPASELFTDVPANSWFHDAVSFVVGAGLFKGTGEKTFSPQAEMTRGMMVTVLHRYAKPDAVSGRTPFTDVEASAYYHDAVLWATRNGIVTGVTDALFAPDSSITREQVVAMLYRYVKANGTPSAGKSYAGFADAGSVSAYADEAMRWAIGAGLITGRENNQLAPKAGMTRAELAIIFQRFGKL